MVTFNGGFFHRGEEYMGGGGLLNRKSGVEALAFLTWIPNYLFHMSTGATDDVRNQNFSLGTRCWLWSYISFMFNFKNYF